MLLRSWTSAATPLANKLHPPTQDSPSAPHADKPDIVDVIVKLLIGGEIYCYANTVPSFIFVGV